MTSDTIDFSQYRLHPLDRIVSPKDPRDFLWTPALGERLTLDQLPSSVDLHAQGLIGDILDQGQEGSCTGHAEASLRTHLDLKNALAHTEFSRAFAYYEGRKREGTTNQDGGAYLKDGLQVLVDEGIPPESFMPYVAGQFTVAPSAQAYAEALKHKIDSYKALTSVADVYNLMAAENRAGVVAMAWYQEFYTPNQAVMPRPTSAVIGGHAVLWCGYMYRPNPYNGGQQECMIRIHNSWSTQFGDGGHFYIPISYFDQIVYERWTGYAAVVNPPNPPNPTPVFPQDLLDDVTTVLKSAATTARRVGLDPAHLVS